MDPRQFRDLIGRFATGVTVITTEVDGLVHGMTANAISSVSLDPLLLLVCVGRESRCHEQLLASERFAVNLLTEDQEHLSNHFARSDDPTHDLGKIGCRVGQMGLPLLDGCLGYFECTKHAEFDGGDHTIFVGRVEHGELLLPEARPLLFFGGQYERLAQSASPETEQP